MEQATIGVWVFPFASSVHPCGPYGWILPTLVSILVTIAIAPVAPGGRYSLTRWTRKVVMKRWRKRGLAADVAKRLVELSVMESGAVYQPVGSPVSASLNGIVYPFEIEGKSVLCSVPLSQLAPRRSSLGGVQHKEKRIEGSLPYISEAPSCQLDVYEETPDGKHLFVGHAVRLRNLLITAAHVACAREIVVKGKAQALRLNQRPPAMFFNAADFVAFELNDTEWSVLQVKTATLGKWNSGAIVSLTYRSRDGTTLSSRGVSSQLSRTNRQTMFSVRHKATTEPGASGAPIFNRGKLVGIHLGSSLDGPYNRALCLEFLRPDSHKAVNLTVMRSVRKDKTAFQTNESPGERLKAIWSLSDSWDLLDNEGLKQFEQQIWHLATHIEDEYWDHVRDYVDHMMEDLEDQEVMGSRARDRYDEFVRYDPGEAMDRFRSSLWDGSDSEGGNEAFLTSHVRGRLEDTKTKLNKRGLARDLVERVDDLLVSDLAHSAAEKEALDEHREAIKAANRENEKRKATRAKLDAELRELSAKADEIKAKRRALDAESGTLNEARREKLTAIASNAAVTVPPVKEVETPSHEDAMLLLKQALEILGKDAAAKIFGGPPTGETPSPSKIADESNESFKRGDTDMLSLFSEGDQYTAAEVSSYMGIGKRRANQRLYALVDEGTLRRIGSRPPRFGLKDDSFLESASLNETSHGDVKPTPETTSFTLSPVSLLNTDGLKLHEVERIVNFMPKVSSKTRRVKLRKRAKELMSKVLDSSESVDAEQSKLMARLNIQVQNLSKPALSSLAW